MQRTSGQILYLWILLRRELDGCSDTDNDCSAMDKVFSSEKNIYRAVLDGFIDNAEQITDSKSHVYESVFKPVRIMSESRAISTLKTNSVYFRSFLNIYGSRIPSAVMDDYIRTYRLRMEKFEAVTSDHSLSYSVRSSASILVLTGAALVTAVASMISALGRGGKAPLLFVRPSRRPSRAAGRRIRTSRSS